MNEDVAAREARERAELRAPSCDGCAQHAELYRLGYRMTELAPADEVAAKPVKLRARYDGSCSGCGATIAVDDPIWWTHGTKGVQCASCGAGAR